MDGGRVWRDVDMMLGCLELITGQALSHNWIGAVWTVPGSLLVVRQICRTIGDFIYTFTMKATLREFVLTFHLKLYNTL